VVVVVEGHADFVGKFAGDDAVELGLGDGEAGGGACAEEVGDIDVSVGLEGEAEFLGRVAEVLGEEFGDGAGALRGELGRR